MLYGDSHTRLVIETSHLEHLNKGVRRPGKLNFFKSVSKNKPLSDVCLCNVILFGCDYYSEIFINIDHQF